MSGTSKAAESNIVSESVDDAVSDHPWLETVAQVGWIAKGVVYTLMGLATGQIALQTPSSDENASPEGAIKALTDIPFGRVVLASLTVGLLLYVAWRGMSVAMITGTELKDWADRVGYTFSAVFYLLLAYTSGKAAITGIEPKESTKVEDLSRSVMEVTAGRTMVGIAGVTTIAVGIFFAVHKGARRSFADDLDGVHESPSLNAPKRRALLISGVVGWIGRGIVTILVGFFVLRASIQFDPDEARGFDKALREVSGSLLGSSLVMTAALGLVAYGVFCLFSHRFRSLDESP